MRLCDQVSLLLEECGRPVDSPVDPAIITQVYSTMEDMKKWYVEKVIRACQGNKSAAARTMGIDVHTVYNLLR